MKTLLKILILFVFPVILWAQEPVVFHFNFSFEKEYGKGWYDPNLSNDLVYITIKIYTSDDNLIYKKHFEKPDFVKDKYGICLLADTVKQSIKLNKNYILNVKYKFVNNVFGKSLFQFKTNDSIKNIALELFFDQAKPKNEIIVDSSRYWFPEYEIITNPKPALVVKYLKENENTVFLPTWFDYVRLTRRPIYVFLNSSNDTIFIRKQNSFFGFRGYLDLMDIDGTWKPYFYGATCGTGSGERYIKPGDEYFLYEANAIGNPLKLQEGFYKYFANYLNKDKVEKTAVTYFNVIYSK